MNGNDLLKGFSYVDDDLIEKAEQIKAKKSVLRFTVPAAAVFAVVLTALLIWSGNQNDLPISSQHGNPPLTNGEDKHTGSEYTLHFNTADGIAARDILIKGHFWHELNENQKSKLLPEIEKKYETESTAHYSYTDGITSVYCVNTNFKTDGRDVTVTLSPAEIGKCCVLSGERTVSEIEGIKIDAGIFIPNESGGNETSCVYFADFSINGVFYYAQCSGSKGDEAFFTDIIAGIILGEKADLSVLDNPDVPELRDDKLTENEAYDDSVFGIYLPQVPENYSFEGAVRFINQDSNYLLADWSLGYSDIRIKISYLEEQDKERIVSVEQKELYDMSLYPIPWADSMPEDKREIIENPIFRIEELTAEAVKMREYDIKEQGFSGEGGTAMRFSVLYGDVLVQISTEKVSSEYLFNELLKIAGIKP